MMTWGVAGPHGSTQDDSKRVILDSVMFLMILGAGGEAGWGWGVEGEEACSYLVIPVL